MHPELRGIVEDFERLWAVAGFAEQRAAFLLHDVFGYDHGEIGTILGKTEASCRQLASRARRRVHDDKPRFGASREQRQRPSRSQVPRPAGRLINVISLDIADGAVQTIRSIINPDKLTHLGPLSPIGRRSNTAEWTADTPEDPHDG